MLAYTGWEDKIQSNHQFSNKKVLFMYFDTRCNKRLKMIKFVWSDPKNFTLESKSKNSLNNRFVRTMFKIKSQTVAVNWYVTDISRQFRLLFFSVFFSGSSLSLSYFLLHEETTKKSISLTFLILRKLVLFIRWMFISNLFSKRKKKKIVGFWFILIKVYDLFSILFYFVFFVHAFDW